jgi:hypothetical protein
MKGRIRVINRRSDENVFGISRDKLLDESVQGKRSPRRCATRACGRHGRGYSQLSPAAAPLRDSHSFPSAAFFFPVVERLAVNFVNGSFCDSHAARVSSHEEVNVIDCAVGSFHIDTNEIFAAAKTREPIVMNFHQIEREIFATILDVKLSVARFFDVIGDVFLNSDRDISRANLSRLHAVLLGS